MSQSSKVLKEFGAVTTTGGAVEPIYGTGALGAVSLATKVSVISTTGAATGTLGDGTPGAEKILIMAVDGGDFVLTPANLFSTPTTITFDTIGDAAHLVFVNGNWMVISASATVA
jgi:hypothetical protein